MSKNNVLLVCASLFAVGDLRAQDPDVQKELKALRERLDEIEDQQAKTSERLGSRALAQAYTALSLDVGGHVTSVFSYIDGESALGRAAQHGREVPAGEGLSRGGARSGAGPRGGRRQCAGVSGSGCRRIAWRNT